MPGNDALSDDALSDNALRDDDAPPSLLVDTDADDAAEADDDEDADQNAKDSTDICIPTARPANDRHKAGKVFPHRLADHIAAGLLVNGWDAPNPFAILTPHSPISFAKGDDYSIYRVFNVEEDAAHSCKPPDIPTHKSDRQLHPIYRMSEYTQHAWADEERMTSVRDVARQCYPILATDAADWFKKRPSGRSWMKTDGEIMEAREHYAAAFCRAALSADASVCTVYRFATLDRC
jgi:hypothetical protein